jgi:hypothetical protein
MKAGLQKLLAIKVLFTKELQLKVTANGKPRKWY